MTDRERAVEALSHIARHRAEDYETWVLAGMILHRVGCSCADWAQWSQQASNYHAGECERKWNSFGGSYSGPTAGLGTLIQWGKEDDRGWKPKGRMPDITGGHALDWDSPIGRRKETPAPVPTGPAVRLPDPAPDCEPGDTIRYLQALFKPEEKVSLVLESFQDKDGKFKPGGRGVYCMTCAQIVDEIRKGGLASIASYNPAAGAWVRANPVDGMGVNNDNITDCRYVLCEADDMPVEDQYRIIQELKLPTAAVLHSGGKSVHAIVKVDAGPDRELYRQRVEKLFSVLESRGFRVDRQCKNPARLSRLPGVVRGERRQYLLGLNVGCASWVDFEASLAPKTSYPPAIDADEWLSKEPETPDQVLAGTFDVGDKAVLIAPSKLRKSFFFLQLLISLSAGETFLAWSVPKARRCLLVQFEIRAHHCHRRVKHMAKRMGVTDIRHNLHIINARGLPLDDVFAAVLHYADVFKIEVLAFDPFYKMHTGDENSAMDVKPLLQRFDEIAERTGAAVLYVHHDPKGAAGEKNIRDRGAGSNVVSRDYDACFTLTPGKREGDIVAECLMRNYKPQDPVALHWDDGKFTWDTETAVTRGTSSSKSAVPAEAYEQDALRTLGNHAYQKTQMMDMLRAHLEIGQQKVLALIAHMVDKGLLISHCIKSTPTCGKRVLLGTRTAIKELTDKAESLPLSPQ